MIDPTFSVRLAVALVRFTRYRVQIVGSTAWPMADGRTFGTGRLDRDELRGWVSVITYSYSAFGEYYSGIYQRGFRRKKKAEAFWIVFREILRSQCATSQAVPTSRLFCSPISGCFWQDSSGCHPPALPVRPRICAEYWRKLCSYFGK